MPNFIVDPFLVTTPSLSHDDTDLKRWLLSLDSWLTESQSSPFQWRHFYECTQALFLLDRFASFLAMRPIAQRCGLDINLGQLSRRIDSFFRDEARDVRAITATKYVVMESDSIVSPQEFIERNEPDVQQDLIGSLLCLACDKSVGESFASDVYIVTMPFNSAVELPESINVQGTVALTDPDDVGVRLVPPRLDENFPILFSPDDLHGALSPTEIWQGGPTEFLKAVERSAHAVGVGTLLPVRLGPNFWQSLISSTLGTNQSAFAKLVRLCGYISLNQARTINVDLRPLRIDSTPDSPQHVRESDSAHAWRLTITTSGIGWRMHYWHVPAQAPNQTEAIELANVLRKQDDEDISE